MINQEAKQKVPGVKHIIAIASGKGGVGKSTTAVNLAAALSLEGFQVGVVDADIYGPNQPQMLGISQRPESHDNKTIEPVFAHGLQTMSIGYLIDSAQPMIWRGPMVSKALQQLVYETHWQNLDFLVMDLPPGTGDIQLTLAQKIPVDLAIIVTTPQDIALLDARKGLEMFRKVSVPILGIVENMSVYHCPECGHQAFIFGHAGGQQMAAECGAKLLISVPLDLKTRECSDAGTPIVIAEKDSINAQLYRTLAHQVIRFF